MSTINWSVICPDDGVIGKSACLLDDPWIGGLVRCCIGAWRLAFSPGHNLIQRRSTVTDEGVFWRRSIYNRSIAPAHHRRGYTQSLSNNLLDERRGKELIIGKMIEYIPHLQVLGNWHQSSCNSCLPIGRTKVLATLTTNAWRGEMWEGQFASHLGWWYSRRVPNFSDDCKIRRFLQRLLLEPCQLRIGGLVLDKS